MNVLDTLFGPVSKKYCSLFYYLSVWSFFMYVMAVIFAISWGISHSKGIGYYLATIIITLMYLLMYFHTRLLYSMCTR